MKKVLTIIITNVSFPHSLFLFFGGNSIHMSILSGRNVLLAPPYFWQGNPLQFWQGAPLFVAGVSFPVKA